MTYFEMLITQWLWLLAQFRFHIWKAYEKVPIWLIYSRNKILIFFSRLHILPTLSWVLLSNYETWLKSNSGYETFAYMFIFESALGFTLSATVSEIAKSGSLFPGFWVLVHWDGLWHKSHALMVWHQWTSLQYGTICISLLHLDPEIP